MSIANPQIIIFLGRSGCGKGTQGKLLQKKFGFDYLGSGALLRRAAQGKNFTGKKIKKFLNQGILVPLFLISRIWSQKAEKLKEKADLKGLIVDGSPRRLLEAQVMDGIFSWYEWRNVKAVLLDISKEEAYERLLNRRICKKCGRNIPWFNKFKKLKKCDKCGGDLETRSDDKREAIQARMKYYKKEVVPVIDYYKGTGRLVRVSGERAIKKVHQDIIKQITKNK